MNDNKWEYFFRENRHAELALALRDPGKTADVRCLADDQVLLLGGASGAGRQSKRLPKDREVQSVVVTPEKEQPLADFQSLIEETRAGYAGAELSGAAGAGCEQLFDCLAVKLGLADKEFQPGKLDFDPEKPLLAALSYSPDVSPEALLAACRKAEELPRLRTVIPLPLGAGDRIPLNGFTTSGTTDAMVISVLRHFLPREVRVRASWAAMGWKVAQLALVYGADELAGWSAVESLVYGERVRAAARVELDEVELGVEEAGRVFAPWLARREEVAR
jgi:hypothetical protein